MKEKSDLRVKIVVHPIPIPILILIPGPILRVDEKRAAFIPKR